MKILFCLLLASYCMLGNAQELVGPFDLQVAVTSNDGRFQISASYAVPINLCGAFAFLTDYESTEQVPGIVESKIISRVKNRVRVRKVIEEQILLFPVEIKSILEYTETPNTLLTFEQVSGDSKLFRGFWKLVANKEKTIFNYEAVVEPNSIIPSMVIEYFIKNSIQDRFELMANRVAKRAAKPLKCN